MVGVARALNPSGHEMSGFVGFVGLRVKIYEQKLEADGPPRWRVKLPCNQQRETAQMMATRSSQGQ
jgi:hypothetical protein